MGCSAAPALRGSISSRLRSTAAQRALSLRGWRGDLVCGRHRARPPVYDRARAAARYSETTRALAQSFKYGDRHEGLKFFGRWLAKAGAELLGDADLIVPVPLYPARRFNQLAMLAREVARLAGELHG